MVFQVAKICWSILTAVFAFAGGAYACWEPGQITRFANEVAKPHGRLFFAGEHTAAVARGMEGAMESGERAALEVMEIL